MRTITLAVATALLAAPALAQTPTSPAQPICHDRAHYPGPHIHEVQAKPRLSDRPDGMSRTEFFLREYCAQNGYAYGSDACREAFARDWARSSWESGTELTREGFEQLDDLGKDGARVLGRKWEEYRRAFDEGRQEAR